jgi:hypothetical protein
MNSYLVYLALDIANERTREADRYRLAALGRGDHAVPGLARRLAARTLAWVSRSSAAVVRRLDECIADDLVESFGSERLAPSR